MLIFMIMLVLDPRSVSDTCRSIPSSLEWSFLISLLNCHSRVCPGCSTVQIGTPRATTYVVWFSSLPLAVCANYQSPHICTWKISILNKQEGALPFLRCPTVTVHCATAEAKTYCPQGGLIYLMWPVHPATMKQSGKRSFVKFHLFLVSVPPIGCRSGCVRLKNKASGRRPVIFG